MNLSNKVAIVTGARRGIGKGIALALAKAGADVVVSDIDLNDCKAVVKEIEQLGRKGLAVKTDVSNASQVSSLINEAIKKFGKVDILVNNAGIYIQKPILELTEKEWDSVLDINLKSVFLCVKAVLPSMIKSKYGKIVNIASIAGEVGFADSSAYCASKGGIINLTKELALELAKYNINVNAIGPGVIDTAMTKPLLGNPDVKNALLAGIPKKRIGRTEDIANAVVFLASDEADYVTGITLFVDGGWLTQ